MSAPFVTVGSTPECDACHSYYAERHCDDCGENLCPWCNLDRHEPIGKRNHWRPRMYGTDPYAELERNATASADEALRDTNEWKLHSARSANERDSADAAAEAGDGVSNKYTFDATTLRVNVTTEHYLPVSAEEGWDLLGDWDCPFLPWSVDVSSDGSRRVISLPPHEDDAEGEPSLITERLIQRNDRDMYYSYARVPPLESSPEFKKEHAQLYTDLLSKYCFVALPATKTSNGEKKRCILQWTTSVLPKDSKNPKRAAEAVAKFQEGFKPFFDAAIQMED